MFLIDGSRLVYEAALVDTDDAGAGQLGWIAPVHQTDWCGIQGPGLRTGNCSGKEQRKLSVPKPSGAHIILRHTCLRAVIPTPFFPGRSLGLGPSPGLC